jgi:hypothetical protein
MGAALNNKVYIQRGDEDLLPKLMPNIWVVLLGPPYRGHKTSCIGLAAKALMQAFPEVRILADKLTPEAVVHALASPNSEDGKVRIGPTDATGLIQAPEMSVIFGKQQYNTGMVSLITDLYDYREEWRSETIGRGKVVLKNNCLSIIAGSTPKWLQSMIPQDAFTGGFMRRFVIVELPACFYKRIARPKRPADASWAKVIEAFKQLEGIKGQMNWTPSGQDYYDSFYEGFKPTGDEQFDAYKEAECEQVLKLAMLLDINAGRYSITVKALKQAQAILYAISHETFLRIQTLTTNPRMGLVQEIRVLLEQHDILSEGDLLNRVYRSLSQGEKQFYEALAILKKTGIIDPVGKPGSYSYKLKAKKECALTSTNIIHIDNWR